MPFTREGTHYFARREPTTVPMAKHLDLASLEVSQEGYNELSREFGGGDTWFPIRRVVRDPGLEGETNPECEMCLEPAMYYIDSESEIGNAGCNSYWCEIHLYGSLFVFGPEVGDKWRVRA